MGFIMRFFDYFRLKLNMCHEKSTSDSVCKTDLNDDFEKYDSVSPNYHFQEIEGMHQKSFVRFNGDRFADLYKDIATNPNCNYITYVNDLIKSTGYKPKHMSCMLKNFCDDKNGIYNEILSSRICNFFDIPTVYNQKYTMNDCNYLLSVDFLAGNSAIIDTNKYISDIFSEIEIPANIFDSEIDEQLYAISTLLNMHKHAGSGHWNFDEKTLISSYIKQFLIRQCVIHDTDFYPRNFCFVIDDKQNVEMGPVFDIECGFGEDPKYFSQYRNLISINRLYNDLIVDFVAKFEDFMKPQNLKTVFADIDDKDYIASKKRFLKESYKAFLKDYDRLNLLERNDYEKY